MTVNQVKQIIQDNNLNISWEDFKMISNFVEFANKMHNIHYYDSFLKIHLPTATFSDLFETSTKEDWNFYGLTVDKILFYSKLISDSVKKQIINGNSTTIEGGTNTVLFTKLRKKFKTEEQIKIANNLPATSPKSKSLKNFKGKLKESIKINNLLENLYKELK